MAEGGLVERFFGGGEGEEAEAEGVGAAADPFAAAVAADAARFDPELSRDASAYLRKQAHLVEVQTEHLHEQRAVQLDHLKLRRMSERMRVALQTLLVAAGLLLGLGFIGLIWSATHDHGLVVEAFSVPPDLAQRGLSGQVVAKQVLDRLSELQAQTASMRASSSYRNNWGEDLKVEIPETGVSTAEVSRYLRNVLGHETHISGEVYRTASGLTVTARAGEEGPKSFSGADADYDKLIQEASEAVYGQTQPYRYGSYLFDHNRAAEAQAVDRTLLSNADPAERAWGHVGLAFGNAQQGDVLSFAAQLRMALADVPDFAPAQSALNAAEFVLQHPAASLEYGQAFLANRRGQERDISEEERRDMVSGTKVVTAYTAADYPRALALATALSSSHDPISARQGWEFRVLAATAEHDAASARSAVSQLPASSQARDLALIDAISHADRSSLRALQEVVATGDVRPHGGDWVWLAWQPWLAQTLARTGDARGAEALLASTPLDCYVCVRMRGTVASFGGDQAGAERWFAEAIGQAPKLPLAYLERGQARFRSGDLSGAMADARTAARLGPHYADAYGLAGDIRARQQRWREALAEYDQALRYAPVWSAARRAREEITHRV